MQMTEKTSSPMQIAVTGGKGRLGQAVIEELLQSGHTPVCVDVRWDGAAIRDRRFRTRVADLADLGQACSVLSGAQAVIHCAAIPWAGSYPAEVVFRTNALSHFHVLQASALLGIGKVVTASSFQAVMPVHGDQAAAPRYFPLDEGHPCEPDSEYGLSKVVGETANAVFQRQHGIRTASIRLPFIVRADKMHEYPFMTEAEQSRNFWTYIDPRDAARCMRLAAESEAYEAEIFNVCADDTSAPRPTAQLLEQYFPGVELRAPLEGFASPLSNAKAREILGFTPRHTWREKDA